MSTEKEIVKMAESGNAEAQAQMAEKCIIRQDAEGAWKWANLSAAQKKACGLYALGMCYLNGFGTEVSLDKARKLFEESISLGYVRAYTGLAGILTFEGDPFGKEAREYIEKAAFAHDSKGLYLLSLLYKDGLGVVKFLQRFYALLKASALQGYAPAEYELSTMDLDESLSLSLKDRGLELLKDAAEQGYPKAVAFLGYLTLEGKWVEKDEKKAFGMFEEAASKGVAKAMRSLGFCYMNGQGVKQDKEKAAEWFTKAFNAGCQDCEEWAQIALGGEEALAEMLKGGTLKQEFELKETVEKGAADNDPESLFRLGFFYLNGRVGEIMTHEKDVEKGLSLLKESAQLGYADAAYYLGLIYSEGAYEVEPDQEEGKKWFEKAADGGASQAMVNLAKIYKESGEAKKAFALLEKASECDNPEAKALLGWEYADGKIVPMDDVKALQLGMESSEGGCDTGNLLVGKLHLYGIPEVKDLEKAIEYLTKGANQGNVESMVLLGRIFTGEYDPKYLDPEMAEELFMRSVRHHSLDGMYCLGIHFLHMGEKEKGIQILSRVAEVSGNDTQRFPTLKRLDEIKTPDNKI